MEETDKGVRGAEAFVKEYRKNYYSRNKDRLLAMNLEKYHNNKELRSNQMKEYHNRNRDSILDKKNEKINCECGGRYTTANKAVHTRSKKHLAHLEQC